MCNESQLLVTGTLSKNLIDYYLAVQQHFNVCTISISLQQTGQTALMLAAKAGHLNIVKKLITSGAKPDITDKVNSLSTA